MDEKNRISTIQKFINNRQMAGVIYDVLQTSFLKFTGQRDVTLMAAERLALNFLDDAWKELKKHEVQEDEKSTGRRQVGL